MAESEWKIIPGKSEPSWKIIPGKTVPSQPINGEYIDINGNPVQSTNSKFLIEEDLIYPSDLQDQISKKNFMVFHINVSQDTKLERYNLDKLDNAPIRNNTSRIRDTISSSTQNIGDAVLDGAVSSAAKLYNKGDISLGTFNTILNGSHTVKEFGKQITTTKPLKRLIGSVMLYMPINVSTNYNVHYSSQDMGLVGSLSDAASSKNGQALDALANSAGRIIAKIGSRVAASGVNDIAASIGLESNVTGNLNAAINAVTRETFNPRKEQLFDDVGYRNFSYRFDFAPQTQKECDTVIQIINTFKLHMLPELDDSYFFYSFPSEFDIEYHIFGEGQNPYINKISSCALQNMRIEYGPGTNWSTLVNGCPSQIHMHLDFLELVPLNRNLAFTEGM